MNNVNNEIIKLIKENKLEEASDMYVQEYENDLATKDAVDCIIDIAMDEEITEETNQEFLDLVAEKVL